MDSDRLSTLTEEQRWAVEQCDRLADMVSDDRPVLGVVECPLCKAPRLRLHRTTCGNRLYIQCLNRACLLKMQVQVGPYAPAPVPAWVPPALQSTDVAALSQWHECRHLDAMDGGDARCAAGVVFESVVDRSGRRPLYPCLRSDGVSERCPKAEYRSVEEALEEGAKLEEEWEAEARAQSARAELLHRRKKQGVELVLQVVRRPCGHLAYGFDPKQAERLREELCFCESDFEGPFGADPVAHDPTDVEEANRRIREALGNWLLGKCVCGAELRSEVEKQTGQCAGCWDEAADHEANGVWRRLDGCDAALERIVGR